MSLTWYIKRLRAMSVGEIGWRFEQKILSSRERKGFSTRVAVYELDAFGEAPSADFSRLGLNYANPNHSSGNEIELLGDFSYKNFRKRWHAAFQSPVDWPFRYSTEYSFSAEDVPGDIRTNWELNRHYQFVVLAKSFYVTNNQAYLAELSDLFIDWNDHNPFMWGPEWSSPMEESVRLINWLFAAAFLEASEDTGAAELRKRLCVGAWCMAAHVRKHYSRYSSANNHTIVEAAGVAVASVVFGQRNWLEEALALLESEVVLQTHADGVNKEQALHYELFVMEALCLVSHVLSAAGEKLPKPIESQLRSMARYARACCVCKGRYIEFGDDDEGVILNLESRKQCYPEYVLALVSLEIGDGARYAEDVACCETVDWLYSQERVSDVRRLPLVANASIECFREGGVTVVRFDEGRAVLAFDHGPLGFGQLAAHGHADALSVQLFVDGEPVLIDPGTYVYNGNQEARDWFRSTGAHNTVNMDGKNQSEALGPFLWGRKANVLAFSLEASEGGIRMSAEHDGYAPLTACRSLNIAGSAATICDSFSGDSGCSVAARFHFPNSEIALNDGGAEYALKSGRFVRFEFETFFNSFPFKFSDSYGSLSEGTVVDVPFDKAMSTVITINER